MREVTYEEYLEYVKKYGKVIVENTEIKLMGRKKRTKPLAPSNYKLEIGSVWSFPDRGKWATHHGDYRGNWSPYIPRNLILRFSRPGETVLDCMVGSGTTLVECKLLGRNGIGVDINYEATILSWDRLNFLYNPFFQNYKKPTIKIYHGDARNLDLIENNSIDLVATHPPYANIISYSKKKSIEGDLSRMPLKDYLESMREIAEEIYRVLKPGRFCGILIGDTRKHRHYIPLAFKVMQIFLESGFILREDIIKVQWNVKDTEKRWKGLAENSPECWVGDNENKRKMDFYLILHEHLFIFKKPKNAEEIKEVKYSTKDLLQW